MKLRLLLLEECNRKCKGCCNKDWDLSALPVCQDFAGYDEYILTGGEPVLRIDLIENAVKRIREVSDAPIYVYTAWREDPFDLLRVLNMTNGITLTLHTRKDVESFHRFDKLLNACGWAHKSLRLNVFRGISLGEGDFSKWQIKSGMQWIKNCPLPTDEVFMRYEA